MPSEVRPDQAGAGTRQTTLALSKAIAYGLRKSYSPTCVEESFSEVRRSKRPVERGVNHPITSWREPFGVQKRRLCSVRYTVL